MTARTKTTFMREALKAKEFDETPIANDWHFSRCILEEGAFSLCLVVRVLRVEDRLILEIDLVLLERNYDRFGGLGELELNSLPSPIRKRAVLLRKLTANQVCTVSATHLLNRPTAIGRSFDVTTSTPDQMLAEVDGAIDAVKELPFEQLKGIIASPEFKTLANKSVFGFMP